MPKLFFFRLQAAVTGWAVFAGICVTFSTSGALFAQTSSSPLALAELPEAPQPTFTVRSTPSEEDSLPGDLLAAQQGQSAARPPEQNAGGLSLDDLGLTKEQTRADPDMQARLDRRTHMLKVHQRLSLITLAPLAAACISSAAAPPDPRNGGGNTVGRDIHLSLGSVSAGLYAATAYYAIRASTVSDEPARGGIKLHKYLIYLHAPGMILTPILGAMAFNQANNGEKVHGIASAHAAVAWTTVATYSAALLAVSWPIQNPFHKQS